MSPAKFNSLIALEENSLHVYLESTEVLIRIARNILNDPLNPKFRSVSLKSIAVTTKLLPTLGAMECLFDMGFQEGNDNLFLSQHAPLDPIKYIHDELTKRRERKASNHSPQISATPCTVKERNKSLLVTNELTMLQNSTANTFLRKTIFWCFYVQKYENPHLQKKALDLIPIIELNLSAMKCIRKIQLEFKKKNITEEIIDFQEILLRELCNWFNKEFFTWVDTPSCTKCGFIETVHEGMSYDVVPGEDRVERYKCPKCSALILFPRYNDPEKLLETRRGRCGEWANCFCLFCRALGWDSRLIFDETDHVWTEVYSLVRCKWIHCDPCENAVDTPLMYECGWKKKLNYIFAYSIDEIQDVSWRYSQDHGRLLKNRNKCSELELVDFIIKVRNTILNHASPARRKFVLKRAALELVELMKENSANDLEEKERISGSLSWRLLRGEATFSDPNFKPYTWNLNDFIGDQKIFELSYITTKDIYIKNSKTVMTKWMNGVHQLKNVFKKEERDWKMCYLARREGCEKGIVSWKFESVNDYSIGRIHLKLVSQTFESGMVSCKFCSTNSCINVPTDNQLFTTEEFIGCKSVELIVELFGGNSWQHAQIFRQPFGSEEFVFQITINLIENSS